MSEPRHRQNRVKAHREAKSWSQAELARRAGVSRAAISAIEISRLVPSVETALSLASVFGCRVEDLFGHGPDDNEPTWAWAPSVEPFRYWQATVGHRPLLYPVESTACGVIGHDGMFQNGAFIPNESGLQDTTLVMASCDPAANLLAAELANANRIRLIVVPRSSRTALDLLRRRLVHVAGLHFSTANTPDANLELVRENLGAGYRLIRVARWQEGLSVASRVTAHSVRAALNAKLRWVGRECGSAARQCLDELRPRSSTPNREARDHRGVAEAVRCGWADIGVCLRFVTEEAGLRFLQVREECYDLCFPIQLESDPRIQALVKAVQSFSYRRLLGELPGIDSTPAGEIVGIN